MPLSQSDFANDGDSPLLVAIKAQRWDEASKYLASSPVPQPASSDVDDDAEADANDDDADAGDNGDDGEHNMVKIPDEYGNLPLHAAIGECATSR